MLVFLFGLLLLVIAIPLNGFAVQQLWAWFIAPTFHLPELTIPVAYGISLFVSFVAKQSLDVETKKRNEAETAMYIFGVIVLQPLFFLFVGWIVTLFM